MILVVGAGSRVACELVPLLGDRLIRIARRPGSRPLDVLVDSYEKIPDDVFDGVDCVINCVGITDGTPEALQKINVDLPCGIARQARAAGVRRFLQLSSFSVYGNARYIEPATLTAPNNLYGQSKLRADELLLALADDRFSVSVLRVPLIYSPNSMGKLGQLLMFWRRVRLMPVPWGDVRRAMISASLCAQTLTGLAQERESGVRFGADPRPFTYRDAAAARPERLWRLPVPSALTKFVERVAPSLGNRLFADSRLAQEFNLAIVYGLKSQLYHDIGRLNSAD